MSEHYDAQDQDGFAEIAERLDQLEAATYNRDDDDDFFDRSHDIALQSVQDGWSVRQHLETVAEQARQAVYAETAALPQSPPTDAEVLAEAQQIASSAINWKTDGPALIEYMTDKGYDLGPIVATRDPVAIAKSLISVNMQKNLEAENRRIKNAAQTMTGSNSSLEPETAWDQIRNAKTPLQMFNERRH